MTDNNSTLPDVDGDQDGDLLARFDQWNSDVDAHWGEWLTEGQECFDFVAGNQWAADTVAQMLEEQRAPVTFNRVAPTIDAVSGAEIMGRQQVVYEPRQVGATAQNEVLTKGADWVRDECDAEHEESEAFRDALICGMGWTETRMDYDDEPEGKIVIERTDPLETLPDPSCRRANCADARYLRTRKRYSKEEFDELFPGAAAEGGPEALGKRPVIVDPKHRYESGGDDANQDEVVVTEWQWFDTVVAYRIAYGGQTVDVDEEQLEQLREAADKAGQALDYVTLRSRRYRKAFVAAGQVLEVADIPAGEFTRKAITGKRDRNKGIWYGLVRPMMDPQRFANKFVAQLLHIVNTNAKGGLIAEEDAFSDPRKAEETWADPAAITWVKSGALEKNKIKPKTPPEYPQAIERLLTFAITAIRDTTGVNQELLGSVERDQPGVLEHQRKQSAYGILSAFFDSLRRYRKEQGRLLLKFMRLFLPETYLVRIVGEDGSPAYQAIGSAFKDETIKFNVIVDDAPAGPNEKAATFQMLTQLMPLLQQAGLPADVWAEIVTFSPLPSSIATKIAMALRQAEQAKQSDPMNQVREQLAVRGQAAAVAEKEASAVHKQAQATHEQALAAAETRPAGAPLTPTEALDVAKAAKIQSDIVHQQFPAEPVLGPGIR